MRTLMTLALAWCLALALATPVAAQYPGSTITLFPGPNFQGNAQTFNGPMPSLAGFTNVAGSAVVRGGSWQLCARDNFGGQCVTLQPGRYALSGYGMQYRVASLRPVGGAGPGYGAVPPSYVGGPAPDIFLYTQPGLNGRARQLHGAIGNLASVGIGGQVWSASVVTGSWQLCTGIGFRPPCYTVTPGRYRQLFNTGGNLWSARPI